MRVIYRPEFDYRIENIADDRRRVGISESSPDRALRQVLLAFEGAAGINPDELDESSSSSVSSSEPLPIPSVVTELIERYYREQGYLAGRD